MLIHVTRGRADNVDATRELYLRRSMFLGIGLKFTTLLHANKLLSFPGLVVIARGRGVYVYATRIRSTLYLMGRVGAGRTRRRFQALADRIGGGQRIS